MSKRDEERGRFIERMREEGVPETVARKIMRHTRTLERLAVAECNGDYPYNIHIDCHYPHCRCWKGPAFLCRLCDTFVAEPTLRDIQASDPTRGLCQACAIQGHMLALLKPYRVSAVFKGDPRGAVVKLKVPSGRTDDGEQEGLCVP